MDLWHFGSCRNLSYESGRRSCEASKCDKVDQTEALNPPWQSSRTLPSSMLRVAFVRNGSRYNAKLFEINFKDVINEIGSRLPDWH
jgi:hypothetical protein